MKKLTNLLLATIFGAGFSVSNKTYSQNTDEKIKKQYESDYENSKGKRGEGYYKERSERANKLLNKDWKTGKPSPEPSNTVPKNNYESPPPENVLDENKVNAILPYYTPKSSQSGSTHESYMRDLNELKRATEARLKEIEERKAREVCQKENFEKSFFNDKNKENNKNKNWWEGNETKKTEDKNWWEESNDENKNQLNKDKTNDLHKIKSIEEVLKEQQQKKADAEKRGIENSKKLSDLIEKQAGISSETKVWFDEEHQKADEFYKEYYKNDSKVYAEIQKADKLSKIIGYNAYKLGEKTPAGPVLKGMEKYGEIKGKGTGTKEIAKITKDKTAEILPGGELMLKMDDKFYEFMKDKNGKNYWEEGYTGTDNTKNLWKEEVKKADEFFKEHEYQRPKIMPNKRELEKMLNTDVHAPKMGNKFKQTNKIIYESDVAKVIRYRTYQYVKNNTEAGDVIKGLEKIDEIKEKGIENSLKNWWDK